MIKSYIDLPWNGPYLLKDLALTGSIVPQKYGVYLFAQTANRLQPNAPLPAHGDANREATVEFLRRTNDLILYIGKAASPTSNLLTRIPGYLLPQNKETLDKHKGRALLHAYQYESPYLYAWWAVTDEAELVETLLIKELHPVLNTYKQIDPDGSRLKRRDICG